MVQRARHPFTFADYVALEASSSVKHEFFDGAVYAMAGGSPEHAAVSGNVIRLLGAALEGKRCRVFTSDLRVRVRRTGLATYPDTSVVCERLELDPEDSKGHTVLNPSVLVEVLSPSTEAYDRGEKLAHYQRIDTLREVMLVAHDERRVELWRRTLVPGAPVAEAEPRWTLFTFGSGEDVVLESLGCVIAVDAIYRDPLATPGAG